MNYFFLAIALSILIYSINFFFIKDKAKLIIYNITVITPTIIIIFINAMQYKETTILNVTKILAIFGIAFSGYIFATNLSNKNILNIPFINIMEKNYKVISKIPLILCNSVVLTVVFIILNFFLNKNSGLYPTAVIILYQFINWTITILLFLIIIFIIKTQLIYNKLKKLETMDITTVKKDYNRDDIKAILEQLQRLGTDIDPIQLDNLLNAFVGENKKITLEEFKAIIENKINRKNKRKKDSQLISSENEISSIAILYLNFYLLFKEINPIIIADLTDFMTILDTIEFYPPNALVNKPAIECGTANLNSGYAFAKYYSNYYDKIIEHYCNYILLYDNHYIGFDVYASDYFFETFHQNSNIGRNVMESASFFLEKFFHYSFSLILNNENVKDARKKAFGEELFSRFLINNLDISKNLYMYVILHRVLLKLKNSYSPSSFKKENTYLKDVQHYLEKANKMAAYEIRKIHFNKISDLDKYIKLIKECDKFNKNIKVTSNTSEYFEGFLTEENEIIKNLVITLPEKINDLIINIDTTDYKAMSELITKDSQLRRIISNFSKNSYNDIIDIFDKYIANEEQPIDDLIKYIESTYSISKIKSQKDANSLRQLDEKLSKLDIDDATIINDKAYMNNYIIIYIIENLMNKGIVINSEGNYIYTYIVQKAVFADDETNLYRKYIKKIFNQKFMDKNEDISKIFLRTLRYERQNINEDIIKLTSEIVFNTDNISKNEDVLYMIGSGIKFNNYDKLSEYIFYNWTDLTDMFSNDKINISNHPNIFESFCNDFNIISKTFITLSENISESTKFNKSSIFTLNEFVNKLNNKIKVATKNFDELSDKLNKEDIYKLDSEVKRTLDGIVHYLNRYYSLLFEKRNEIKFSINLYKSIINVQKIVETFPLNENSKSFINLIDSILDEEKNVSIEKLKFIVQNDTD